MLDKIGKCPRAWLCEERLSRGVQLLLNKVPVKETAALLGYKNQHHFSREFKKLYGYPPTQHSKIFKGAVKMNDASSA